MTAEELLAAVRSELNRTVGQANAAETQLTKTLALEMSDAARTEATRARGFVRGVVTQAGKTEAALAALLAAGGPPAAAGGVWLEETADDPPRVVIVTG